MWPRRRIGQSRPEGPDLNNHEGWARGMGTHNLQRLFDPKSIAVIGASNRKGSVG